MKLLLLVTVLLVCLAPAELRAQLTERRVERLETRVEKLERAGRNYGSAAFVAAVVAALWAQNTRRNAWSWFFLTFFFAPIALLALLYKNSNDRENIA